MQVEYYKEYSNFLKHDMEFKVYGHKGLPCLAFACEGGRFYDWEDNGMISALSPFIENGQIQVFTADSVDDESWLGDNHDLRYRAEAQERWFNYIVNELVPRIQEISGGSGKILSMGTSLGGGHAVNVYLRRPALFCGAIGLSGSYLPSTWFETGEEDDLILRNSPIHILRSKTNADIKKYSGPLWVCCGQGPYESSFLVESKKFAEVGKLCKLNHNFELWSDKCSHDWYWWQKQIAIFVPRCLDALVK